MCVIPAVAFPENTSPLLLKPSASPALDLKHGLWCFVLVCAQCACPPRFAPPPVGARRSQLLSEFSRQAFVRPAHSVALICAHRIWRSQPQAPMPFASPFQHFHALCAVCCAPTDAVAEGPAKPPCCCRCDLLTPWPGQLCASAGWCTCWALRCRLVVVWPQPARAGRATGGCAGAGGG